MSEVVRVRLDLGYDGTDFSGWAAQTGRRTVEGVRPPASRQSFEQRSRCG